MLHVHNDTLGAGTLWSTFSTSLKVYKIQWRQNIDTCKVLSPSASGVCGSFMMFSIQGGAKKV